MLETQGLIENRKYAESVGNDLQIAYDKGELREYFDDVLDFEYHVTSRKEYKAVRVFLTLGGPTCWVDTCSNTVNVSWGGNGASWYLPIAIANVIDEIFQEIYDNQS